MSNDLLAVMDHLEIEQAHLVGHSTGGAIGQTIAVTNPERLKSLVIYASWTKADPFFRRVFEARRTLLTEAGAAAYVRSTPVFLYPDWWINENIALLEEREAIGIPAFPPEIVASRIDAIVDFDRTADLPKIRTPTLVICAKDDILTPPYFAASSRGSSRAPSSSSWNAAGIALRRRTPRSSMQRSWGSSLGIRSDAACGSDGRSSRMPPARKGHHELERNRWSHSSSHPALPLAASMRCSPCRLS